MTKINWIVNKLTKQINDNNNLGNANKYKLKNNNTIIAKKPDNVKSK